MIEYRGWLLDLYPDGDDGLTLWLAAEDGSRVRLSQPFPITFYAAGSAARLGEIWRYLRNRVSGIQLQRIQKRDLFSGLLDVLSIRVENPAEQSRLFADISRRFPDLDYYDADVPITVRYAARYDIFPLSHCALWTSEEGIIMEVQALNSRWDLDPDRPPLRVLTIEPDVNPFQKEPAFLHVRCGSDSNRLALRPSRQLLIRLRAKLARYDPDVIATNWGDTWLFPFLLETRRRFGDLPFNLNRDSEREVAQRQERSYVTYGQVVYRGRQVHLFGRWHIDRWNAMMFGQYGLEGVLEQAQVTGLPVQEVARKSPGAGITAMQMIVALREEILIPFQKQQAERFKSARELIRADRGGLVYQPLVGLHENVAEIDFVSMYPSIMVRFNISPESVGTASLNSDIVPEIGLPVDQTEPGLVPLTLQPLLAKRIAIKKHLANIDRRDCRYKSLKARSDALKWLLVVCFGYLGYKNARFGRIESHEAVTAYGREALLRAKETAEDMGFTVLHMYVDGLWVCQPDHTRAADFQALLDQIAARTGLPIALEGIYRWITFLPSRLDGRVPVANRYFGVFQNGLLKARGIDVRRRDTAPFVATAQLKALMRLAKASEEQRLEECLSGALDSLREDLSRLRSREVALEQLVVSQTLSRTLDEYRVPSPAARAAAQLKQAGKELRPGQRVRFLFTHGEPGVWAWDLPEAVPRQSVDFDHYTELLLRAAAAILQPLNMEEEAVRNRLLGNARQQTFAFA